MGKSIKRSRASIVKYLKAQPQSGLTVERFCKKHHIAVSSFWNWRKKYGNISADHKPSQFVKLTPVAVTATPAIELRTGSFTIKVPCGNDENSIRSILTVMMDICSERNSHVA